MERKGNKISHFIPEKFLFLFRRISTLITLLTCIDNHSNRFLATSQFEAYKLRRVFPCFDEPSYRAIFYMKLKYNAQFNGTYFVTQEHSSNIEDTPGDYGIIWKTTTYRPTVRMAPYALAFVISDFERKVIIHGAHEDERIITNVRHLEVHRLLISGKMEAVVVQYHMVSLCAL